MGKIAIKLPRKPQAFINLERAVNIRIINQSLPSDRRPRFLEIRAHDDEEARPRWHLGAKEFGVLEGLGGGVDRAWTDYDKDAIVIAGKDAGCAISG
jgi:hypothetical protein